MFKKKKKSSQPNDSELKNKLLWSIEHSSFFLIQSIDNDQHNHDFDSQDEPSTIWPS